MTGLNTYGTCMFCWRLNASLQLASEASTAWVCSKCARTIQTVLGFLDFTRSPEKHEVATEEPQVSGRSGKTTKDG